MSNINRSCDNNLKRNRRVGLKETLLIWAFSLWSASCAAWETAKTPSWGVGTFVCWNKDSFNPSVLAEAKNRWSVIHESFGLSSRICMLLGDNALIHIWNDVILSKSDKSKLEQKETGYSNFQIFLLITLFSTLTWWILAYYGSKAYKQKLLNEISDLKARLAQNATCNFSNPNSWTNSWWNFSNANSWTNSWRNFTQEELDSLKDRIRPSLERIAQDMLSDFSTHQARLLAAINEFMTLDPKKESFPVIFDTEMFNRKLDEVLAFTNGFQRITNDEWVEVLMVENPVFDLAVDTLEKAKKSYSAWQFRPAFEELYTSMWIFQAAKLYEQMIIELSNSNWEEWDEANQANPEIAKKLNFLRTLHPDWIDNKDWKETLKDFYKILGLKKWDNLTHDDITSVYIKRVRSTHPDSSKSNGKSNNQDDKHWYEVWDIILAKDVLLKYREEYNKYYDVFYPQNV